MTTVLDALVARLTEAGAHNQGAEVPPAIVLWSDG